MLLAATQVISRQMGLSSSEAALGGSADKLRQPHAARAGEALKAAGSAATATHPLDALFACFSGDGSNKVPSHKRKPDRKKRRKKKKKKRKRALAGSQEQTCQTGFLES